MPPNLQSWIISFICCSEEMAYQWKTFSYLRYYILPYGIIFAYKYPITDAFNALVLLVFLFFFSSHSHRIFQRIGKKRVSCQFNIVYHSPQRISIATSYTLIFFFRSHPALFAFLQSQYWSFGVAGCP